MAAPDTGARIEAFVARHTPAVAAQLRDARQRLRAHFPRGVAQVDALADAPPLATVIKAEVGRQRPRRPAPGKA